MQRQSPDIATLRTDLAAALRLAAFFNLHEGIDNHFSVMLDDGSFLVNRWGVHWSRIATTDLLQVDADGAILSGTGHVERTAMCIHSAIHRANSEARAVFHVHMPYTTALCCTSGRLEWISQNSLRFLGRVAYDEHYQGEAMEEGEGARLARKLGKKSILLMRHHGVTVTAPTIARAFADLYFLERAAQVQMLARASGYRLRKLRGELATRTAQQIQAVDDFQDHFDALKLLLEGAR